MYCFIVDFVNNEHFIERYHTGFRSPPWAQDFPAGAGFLLVLDGGASGGVTLDQRSVAHWMKDLQPAIVYLSL